MINKKIAMSALSIVAALSLAGGATYAFFSDTATSTGNTFATGTINLQVDDANEITPAETVTASISDTTMLPGGTPSTGFVSLHNGGTVPMAEVEFGTTVTPGTNPDSGASIANVINMTVRMGDNNTCTTNGVDLTGTLATQFGGTLPLTLAELNGQTYDALPGLTAGQTKYVCMTAQMDASAGDTYQGDSLSVDFGFKGNQDASQ